MPSLGSDMTAGTLVEWMVKPGDRVKRGDIIAVVDTDKAAIEIEVFEDGVVEELCVQVGRTVPVGTVMAIIRTDAAPVATEPVSSIAMTESVPTVGARKAPELGKAPPEEPFPSAGPPAAAEGERIKASPYARRLAAERSLDLKTILGTGEAGAIHAADVERTVMTGGTQPPKPAFAAVVAETTPVAPREETAPARPATERPVGTDYQAAMRRAIAAAMAKSNREIPHYYLQTRIDMSRTLRWLESENLKRSIKERILLAVPLLRAVAMALEEVPELNGYWMDDRHQVQESINIGFAISLRQGGLITPAILGADQKNVDELMEALRDLITRTRAARLRSSEMTDATITVTSLGDLGVETVYGVIYPPQVALVGFGKIMDQPWAENGLLGVRPVITATLAGDHRATDGRRGGQFLDCLNRTLQEPSKL